MLTNRIRPIAVVAAVALTALSTTAFAADQPTLQSDLHQIASQWAHITYQVKDDDAKEAAMTTLAGEAEQVAARHPDRAEPLVWYGVVASSQARYAGVFSAMGYAKQARDLLEKAARIDYRTLNGSAMTSLGALYYMVPGFPIGFGDNDKARRYLQQAVDIDPNGLDSNYFYGDFLYRTGEYRLASAVLHHALKAQSDPNRPVWDAGRRAEAHTLLAKIEAELASSR